MRLSTGHENARGALECGSLLPLSASELARAISVTRTAGKPAYKKRQQAAALQSACGARVV